jgi:hypothetical protein
MPAKPTGMWQCPKCKRRFARRRQAHSCQVVPLARHLDAAPPAVRRIYERIIRALRAEGPLQIAPTKTSINLLSGTSLGGISLHKTHVNLGFVLTRRLEHPRVAWVLRLSPRSYAHRVRVGAEAEVDAQLLGWLREAYQVGRMAGRRPA